MARRRRWFVALVFVGCLGHLKRTADFHDSIGKEIAPRVGSDVGFDVLLSKSADVCLVERAMKQQPMLVKTYFMDSPALLPHPAIPHLSSALCRQQHQHQQTTPSSKEHVSAILCFKAARTGSSFFSGVITRTIQQFRPKTHLLFEPYCNPECRGPERDATEQSNALAKILSQRCSLQEPASKCEPDRNCRPYVIGDSVNASRQGDAATTSLPLSISALNPRFLNPQIDWNVVFPKTPAKDHQGQQQGPSGAGTARIFALRRTNLVLMGYSKFQHKKPANAGCGTRPPSPFTFDALVRCAEHYALGDQELSSSIAWKAARAAGSDPFLIVYEDVLANGPLIQQGMMQHVGLTKDAIKYDVFRQNVTGKKVHKTSICSYHDVDCDELERHLSGGNYPCLYKQLKEADKGRSWSVPMFPNGTVHIQGDCHPLPPCSETSPVRQFHELYQLA